MSRSMHGIRALPKQIVKHSSPEGSVWYHFLWSFLIPKVWMLHVIKKEGKREGGSGRKEGRKEN